MRQYPGGYADYERQRQASLKVRKFESLKVEASQPSSTTLKPSNPQTLKLSYNEQRELAALPDRIDALEKEIAAIEAFLADGSNYAKDPAKCKSDLERLSLAKGELDAAESRWLELEERKV